MGVQYYHDSNAGVTHMCFSVALTRETIENDPRFAHLLDEMYQTPGSRISGFSFPGLPILTDQLDKNARLAHWGLIPDWVRDDAQAKRIRSGTLNARGRQSVRSLFS